LWQLAYTELYFTDILWPAFDRNELDKAIASYQKRERRFGRTSEQLDPGEQLEERRAGAQDA
jgi:undecaprenyl diphosphate synthase